MIIRFSLSRTPHHSKKYATKKRRPQAPAHERRAVLRLGRLITPIVTLPPAHAGQPYRPPLDPASQTLHDQRVSSNKYQPHPGKFRAADAFRRMLVRFAHCFLPRTKRTGRVLQRKKRALAHHDGRAFSLPCSYNTPDAWRLPGAPGSPPGAVWRARVRCRARPQCVCRGCPARGARQRRGDSR